jgi:hypothetical protein
MLICLMWIIYDILPSGVPADPLGMWTTPGLWRAEPHPYLYLVLPADFFNPVT